jgi:uncharacterized protein (TIGR02118 family)
MHKVLVLYKTQKDPAHFKSYYEATHLKLAAKLPGMLKYDYSFDIKPMGPGEPPFFCMFEAEFPDEATFEAAMASPEGQALGADIPNYVTGEVTLMHFTVK